MSKPISNMYKQIQRKNLKKKKGFPSFFRTNRHHFDNYIFVTYINWKGEAISSTYNIKAVWKNIKWGRDRFFWKEYQVVGNFIHPVTGCSYDCMTSDSVEEVLRYGCINTTAGKVDFCPSQALYFCLSREYKLLRLFSFKTMLPHKVWDASFTVSPSFTT